MSDNITDRQKKILAATIEQYAEVASPVGSIMLAKLFNVSSATIRNDMVALEKAGYIKQPHTSAGRIPTDKGYRYFVNSLDSKSSKNASYDRPTKAINSRINSAGEPVQIIHAAVKSLVDLTHNVALATIGSSLYVRGYSSLFAQPELSDATSALEVARLLDNLEPWLREAAPNEPLSVYIGRENPIGKSSECSLVISRFRSPFSDHSYVGVLGPTRQNYPKVMGLVRSTGRMLEEVFV
jgi:heat-inducible transcriptional repressor